MNVNVALHAIAYFRWKPTLRGIGIILQAKSKKTVTPSKRSVGLLKIEHFKPFHQNL
jgi:hypothetical protein